LTDVFTQCLVAVKKFTIKRNSPLYLRDDFLREKDSLVEVSKWHHEHILGMLGTFETRCSRFDTLNLVLPFADGGNLHHFLRLEIDDFIRLERNNQWEKQGYPMSDPSLVGCLKDWRYCVYRQAIGLVDALAELHEEKQRKFIMHCDIKPANVLIQDGKFKLADFGLSRFKDGDETSQTEWHRGTAMYSPPERQELMGRGRDVWALGCVLLEIALMIRFAGQNILAFENTGHKNMIDIFEIERKSSPPKGGGEKTAIYHKTMGCVHNTIGHFNGMRPGLRRKITLEGMIPTIRGMMEEDQQNRITAAEAYATLKRHYLSLQSDSQLQRPIEWKDNPGGPPADCDDNCIPIGSPQARREATGFVPREQGGGPFRPPPINYGIHHQSFTGEKRVFLASESGFAVDSRIPPDAHPPSTPDSQFSKPSLPRNTPAESLSSSATAQLDELDIQDRKRPASAEDLSEGSKRRRASPFY
jgi:serine/threonine protein kinase